MTRIIRKPALYLALLLIGLAAALLMPKTAKAADITISDWTAVANPITLNDTDVLTITATGSPASATLIQVAANANVTIIGPGNANEISNLYISCAGGGTLTIQNLNISHNSNPVKLVSTQLIVRESNTITCTGVGEEAITDMIGTVNITSASAGSLTASSVYFAVVGTGLNVGEDATVMLTSSGQAPLSVNNLSVGSGATLNCATPASSGLGTMNALTIINNGTINISTTYAQGNAISCTSAAGIAYSGSGTLTATSTDASAIDCANGNLTINSGTVRVSNSGTAVLVGAQNMMIDTGTLIATNNSAILKTIQCSMTGPGDPWIVTGGTVTENLTDNTISVAIHNAGTATITRGSTADLGNQTIAITAPATGAAAQNAIAAGTGYTGTISWKTMPADAPLVGNFVASTVYKATVVLTSTTGYQWPAIAPTITVTGQTVANTAVTGTGTGNTLSFDVTFAATGAAVVPPNFGSNYGGSSGPISQAKPVIPSVFPAKAVVTSSRMNIYLLDSLKGKIAVKLSKGDTFILLGMAGNGKGLKAKTGDITGYVSFNDFNATFGAAIKVQALKKAPAYIMLESGKLKYVGYYKKDHLLWAHGVSGKYLINKQKDNTYYLRASDWKFSLE